MKRLFNATEERAFEILQEVAKNCGYEVYPKVRVADVLSIEGSGISPDLYSYALKAHFDFVVFGDSHIPEFAVEFDGPSHRSPIQKKRDEKKNTLCKRFGLPLLRSIESHISQKYRDMTVLGWIIEVYYLKKAFSKAQEQGHVPDDEPFDPFSFIQVGERKKQYPYWLSINAKISLKRFFEQGRVKDWGTSGFIGYDDQDVMRGIEFLRVSATEGLAVESAMRSQQFPIVLSNLFDELLSIMLFEKLERYFRGEEHLLPMTRIWARAEELRSKLKLARAHSCTSAS